MLRRTTILSWVQSIKLRTLTHSKTKNPWPQKFLKKLPQKYPYLHHRQPQSSSRTTNLSKLWNLFRANPRPKFCIPSLIVRYSHSSLNEIHQQAMHWNPSFEHSPPKLQNFQKGLSSGDPQRRLLFPFRYFRGLIQTVDEKKSKKKLRQRGLRP